MTPGTRTPEIETFEFQAETRRLLELMIHSLYTHQDIFLRELISNASDALDRLRFAALTESAIAAGGEPEIRLDPDAEARTLTVRDNGIGMSRREVIDNLGTIARSGTRELAEALRQRGGDGKEASELIGQFGVGFYSSFMVADRVEVVTRRAGDEVATRWESAGDGTFTVADAEREGHGTTITLHLKPADAEEGLEDFTDPWVLQRVVKRYSDFVIYPIRLEVEREEPVTDEEGKPTGETRTVAEDRTVNSMKPIWTRPESEVTAEEHEEFYRHISHDWKPPLTHVTLKAEGRFEYQALLYIPQEAPYDLYYLAFEPGLQLYVRRVMIQEHCAELLPRYLRFVKGVVEAPDLPLNVSRETLQSNRQLAAIGKGLVKKVLDTLAAMKRDERPRYLELWEQFGRAIKEGIGTEHDLRERLLELLLFPSSADPAELTDLAGYVERMKEGQKEIFYLTGESREQVEGSPHLEAFRDRGIEVLYLTDPVDELVVQSLNEFEGKRLKSVGKGTVELPEPGEAGEERKRELAEREKELEGLLEAIQKQLDAEVKQVRLTNRLTSSPACLVGAEHDYSPQLEKLLLKGKGGGLKQRRILELNPEHEVLGRLAERFAADPADPMVADAAELLYGYATLAEGSELPDPARFNRVLATMMSRSV